MKETAPYFAVVAFLGIMFVMGLVGQCEMKDRQNVPELTREQKAEVMSRQYSDLEREEHIDMADRILNKRVEGNWREKR
jgi:hypothetical protein